MDSGRFLATYQLFKKFIGKKESTIRSFLKRWQTVGEGAIAPYPINSGRKPVLTAHDERALVRSVRVERRNPLEELKNEVKFYPYLMECVIIVLR